MVYYKHLEIPGYLVKLVLSYRLNWVRMVYYKYMQ